MVRSIDSTWRDEIDRLQGQSPFVWTFDIPLHVDDTLNLYARLTPYPEKLVVDGTRTYYPWPMSLSAIEEQQDGDLPQARLEIGNHGRLLAPYFESPGDARGIMGKRVIATLRNLADLSVEWQFGWRVNGAVLDREACVLSLEQPNWFARQVPQDRFNVRICRWIFGSPECGYVINAAAGFTTCPRTYPACVLRGLDMALRGLPQLQPQRFGAFLGMLVQ